MTAQETSCVQRNGETSFMDTLCFLYKWSHLATYDTALQCQWNVGNATQLWRMIGNDALSKRPTTTPLADGLLDSILQSSRAWHQHQTCNIQCNHNTSHRLKPANPASALHADCNHASAKIHAHSCLAGSSYASWRPWNAETNNVRGIFNPADPRAQGY